MTKKWALNRIEARSRALGASCTGTIFLLLRWHRVGTTSGVPLHRVGAAGSLSPDVLIANLSTSESSMYAHEILVNYY